MSQFWHGLKWISSSKNGMGADDQYKFQPLRTPTTIRLIKICRRRVKGCIACRIYHFDKEQQEDIQYQALSYVWGDSRATRQIFLKGANDRWRPFHLHENLWQFLNHAWRQNISDRLFWTDRLCLNQDNPEEISQQVPRMRTIYHGAELVLIWLHLKEEEERFLLELLRLYPFENRGPEICYEIEQRRGSFNQDIFSRLVENPYWTRVWIVQEVVVARRVYVTCRDSLIPLDELAFLFSRFWEGSISHKPRIWALCHMRDTGRAGEYPLKLSWILMGAEFSGYQSSRPADRVYGMLGLVEANSDGTWPTDNIQVDYDKPILHVLLDAMFESSPDNLGDCERLPRCLGDWKTYDSYSLLQDYAAHKKTMQRQKRFAQFAMQILEAFNIIKSVPGAPDEDTMVGTGHDGYWRSPFWPWPWPLDWKPTGEHCAAVIGLSLARSSSGPLDHWKARWRSRGEESSPWRCAAHRSVDITPTGISSYGPIIARASSLRWTAKGVVEACGERSQSCDGSSMSCEILQLGFRFVLLVPGQEESLILQRKE